MAYSPLYRVWDVAFIRWYTNLKREFGHRTPEQISQQERWEWLQLWRAQEARRNKR